MTERAARCMVKLGLLAVGLFLGSLMLSAILSFAELYIKLRGL